MVGSPSFSPVSGERGGVLICFFVVHLSPYWWPGSGNENFPTGVYDSNSTLPVLTNL